MSRHIKAIAFDFGNTLCPWDAEQYWQITRIVLTQVCAHAPGVDIEKAVEAFSRIRNTDSALNLPRMAENDLPGIYAKTALEVCGRPLNKFELSSIIATHIGAFVGVCRTQDGLDSMLERLSAKYRLAVLSNYPIPDCIRQSLICMGIEKRFDVTVVSGDIGVIKPGKRIFDRLLDELDMPAENVLFVGDDWVADVVGAWAAGMPCVHIMDGHSQAKLEGVFGTYLRKALESPELAGWESAQPLAVLDSALSLESWLEAYEG